MMQKNKSMKTHYQQMMILSILVTAALLEMVLFVNKISKVENHAWLSQNLRYFNETKSFWKLLGIFLKFLPKVCELDFGVGPC